MTAAVVVKPFVDHFDYKKSKVQIADETYIKVRGIKGYVWLIIDSISRSVLGYQVSDSRTVGPCIKAMRMAFRGFDELPEGFKFIADGFSAYPLAAIQFFREFGETEICQNSSAIDKPERIQIHDFLNIIVREFKF